MFSSNHQYKIIIIIIILVFVAKLFVLPLIQGFWWDEVVYLQLSESISHGYYSFEPFMNIETFRPPVFSFLITPFSGDVLAIRLLVFVLSVLSV